MKTKRLLGLSILITALKLQAAGLQLGEPAYGGNGCPAGTASATISPSGDAISILFDKYLASAGGSTGVRLDRKSCNVSIPVMVPQGLSVAVFQVDYRGFNSIPRGGMNRFNVEYFWAGSRGLPIQRVFMGPMSDSFTLTDNILAQSLVWSPCGQSINLRVNSSMMAQTNRNNEETLGIVDTADVSTGSCTTCSGVLAARFKHLMAPQVLRRQKKGRHL